ncbi:hypothetical protein LPJ61_000314 [Coemansia biformis]|uniref:Uncharacterized protein n=1 Tax=Coemansia biformis TaxID=1286918 RepID=A0A9W7YHA9_9FUNG|nr:hypothetical protein LPJ61_000314 [Coemansia biformis]
MSAVRMFSLKGRALGLKGRLKGRAFRLKGRALGLKGRLKGRAFSLKGRAFSLKSHERLPSSDNPRD